MDGRMYDAQLLRPGPTIHLHIFWKNRSRPPVGIFISLPKVFGFVNDTADRKGSKRLGFLP